MLLIAVLTFLFLRRPFSRHLLPRLSRVSIARGPRSTLVPVRAATTGSPNSVSAQVPATPALSLPRSEKVRRRVPHCHRHRRPRAGGLTGGAGVPEFLLRAGEREGPAM